MVQFEICDNIEKWSRFTHFYVKHRQRIVENYKVAHALVDVKNYMTHGRGAILMDAEDQVIGVGSFVLGLAEEGFEQKEIAVLGNCYFVENCRSNRTFIRGLQVIAQQIRELSTAANEVRIPTVADNDYTNRLYAKFADRLFSYDSVYGLHHVYSTSYDQFVQFCSRFR